MDAERLRGGAMDGGERFYGAQAGGDVLDGEEGEDAWGCVSGGRGGWRVGGAVPRPNHR